MNILPKSSSFFSRRLVAILGVLLFIFMQTDSDVLAKDKPPTKLSLEGKTWILYSSGIRDYFYMDLYQCSLYLDRSKERLDSVLELKSPIAIRIKILTSELPGQVPDPWKETIKPEVTDKIYNRFKKQYLKLDKGDILFFTFLPNQSTNLYLNGKKKLKDPGPGLMEALLDQWIGPNPISEDLKIALFKK